MHNDILKILKQNKKIAEENLKRAERNLKLMTNILLVTIINFIIIIGKLIIG